MGTLPTNTYKGLFLDFSPGWLIHILLLFKTLHIVHLFYKTEVDMKIVTVIPIPNMLFVAVIGAARRMKWTPVTIEAILRPTRKERSI